MNEVSFKEFFKSWSVWILQLFSLTQQSESRLLSIDRGIAACSSVFVIFFGFFLNLLLSCFYIPWGILYRSCYLFLLESQFILKFIWRNCVILYSCQFSYNTQIKQWLTLLVHTHGKPEVYFKESFRKILFKYWEYAFYMHLRSSSANNLEILLFLVDTQ